MIVSQKDLHLQAIAECGDVKPVRAQTAYIQGNGPKMMQGMVRGAMGGFELSELTVFWKIIVRLKRQNPVRRFRKPRLGRVVPRRRPM